MTKQYEIDRSDTNVYPMGAVRTEKGMHFSFAAPGDRAALLLYEAGEPEPVSRIEFLPELRMGDVWNMSLAGDFTGLEYVYEVDQMLLEDPCGRQFRGRELWGSQDGGSAPLRAVAGIMADFDWEGDKRPEIPYNQCVFYRLHVRGFTKHPSSGVKAGERGTFKAITEKIPYLKELGVTTLEMQPPVEFDEVMRPERPGFYETPEPEPEVKLNYWGYAPGLMMAPKASYCAGPVKEPVREFKNLVKELHRAGLELVIELYFTGKEYPGQVLETARFWAREYHVDGIRLVGSVPVGLVGADPYLSRIKLLANGWDVGACREAGYLAESNDGFMLDMRRFLKGDERMLDKLCYHVRHNPADCSVINYMADNNGFTLMDMVSYNGKHNEDNGENNRDGTDCNESWNCGAEGATRRKKVLELRRKQIRNALLLLFLSQGTPQLLAGDEFGRTKKGNNNSYCQDNEISWLNWGLLKNNADLYEFTKAAIAFRKAHPVLHMEKEPALLDYRSLGIPDVSYHGVKTWCPEFQDSKRQLGILYCGQYGQKEDGSPDNYLYVIYNMHWEPHEFALPNLPKGQEWHLAVDTGSLEDAGFRPQGSEPLLEDQKRTVAGARSIVVLVGMPGDVPADAPKRSRADAPKRSGANVQAGGKRSQKKIK